MTDLPAYVLITPARNEADYIGRTLTSMVKQTVLPVRWVIVSDGSTDGTDEIVARFASENPWVEFLQMPARSERHFAGKVDAFNAGYSSVKGLNYDIIGNLDGDISFPEDHFEFLLEKFRDDPLLGVAGTAFTEKGIKAYNYDIVSIEHVSGQCQIFRRECFEDIGGYIPIKGGGVDLTAVMTARMKGWKTRTFPERNFQHHRVMGTGSGTLLKSRFRFGEQDYYLGGHLLWEVLRSVYHMKKKPYVVGGLVLLCGYLWGALTRMERPISKELVAFRQKEQLSRLRKLLSPRNEA